VELIKMVGPGLVLPAAQSASTTDPRSANHDHQDPRGYVLVWLLIYVFSFSLPAIVDVDNAAVRPGYDCAVLSVLAVPVIGNLFRFQSSALESILESASIPFTALINPLFLL
jgi:hypothetical protein